MDRRPGAEGLLISGRAERHTLVYGQGKEMAYSTVAGRQ